MGHLPGHRNSCILERHSNDIVLSQHRHHGAHSWKADSGLGHLPAATLLPWMWCTRLTVLSSRVARSSHPSQWEMTSGQHQEGHTSHSQPYLHPGLSRYLCLTLCCLPVFADCSYFCVCLLPSSLHLTSSMVLAALWGTGFSFIGIVGNCKIIK